MPRTLLLTMILVLALPVQAQDPAGKISPRLEQALIQSAPGTVQADGTVGVWVYFTDKALSEADLQAALDAGAPVEGKITAESSNSTALVQ